MTFDKLLLLVLANLLVIYVVYRVGRTRGRQIERDETLARAGPICPCGHVLGEHKDGGKCLGDTQRVHYYSNGDRNGYEWVKCVCTKYHGPVLITDDFFHPGVAAQE